MSKQQDQSAVQAQAILTAQKAMTDFIGGIIKLTPAEMELVIPLLKYKQVKKHEFILQEGEICKDVFFVAKGLLRMYYVDDKGKEINYRFANDKNFGVDYQSFLLQKPSHFYWQAMQDTEVLTLANADIQRVYSASPAWGTFGRLIAERVYLQMNERVEMLLFMTPEERYNLLLETQPQLFEQISQFHLSSYLGVKPESLSRLRKRLMKR
jgi:CRP-like cAMP-binding protein